MASWVHNPRYPEVPAARINPSLGRRQRRNRLTAFMQYCEFQLCIPSVPYMRGERIKFMQPDGWSITATARRIALRHPSKGGLDTPSKLACTE